LNIYYVITDQQGHSGRVRQCRY